jgi:hypothetical protein
MFTQLGYPGKCSNVFLASLCDLQEVIDLLALSLAIAQEELDIQRESFDPLDYTSLGCHCRQFTAGSITMRTSVASINTATARESDHLNPGSITACRSGPPRSASKACFPHQRIEILAIQRIHLIAEAGRAELNPEIAGRSGDYPCASRP